MERKLNGETWTRLATGIVFILLIVTGSFAETINYSYDSMRRLTRAHYGDGTVVDYVYDAMGNRYEKTVTLAGAPANVPPNAVTNVTPLNGSNDNLSIVTLSWQAGGDPDSGDVIYQVYLGTSTNQSLITTTRQTSFTISNLNPSTTYYWKIVSKDNLNAETSGPLWSFTTSEISDLTAPVGAIAVAGAAKTNLTTVTLVLMCSDADSGCSQMRFSNDNITWSEAEEISSTKVWTLTLGDGTKTVFVKFKNGGGNWSNAFSTNIVLDSSMTFPSLRYPWAWGANWDGQLGDGTTTDSIAPVLVSGLTDVVAVAAGDYHSLALKSDGTVWAWGDNWYSQLGDGTFNTDRLTPVQVMTGSGIPFSGVIAIDNAWSHSLALKADGTVWAWGDNWYGQLGSGTNSWSNIPVQVPELTGVVAVAAGDIHNLALKSDGTVWAWGDNEFGQLGDGTTNNSSVPVQVSGLTGVVAVGASYYHSIALKSDGTVWAWGSNWFGELGDGTNNWSSIPVQVSGLTGVVAMGVSYHNNLALKSDGTVWAWGANWYGQLGDGTNNHSNVPVRVSHLTGVVALGPGGYHNLALKSDGTLWAWGANWYGQLGDGTTSDRSVPVLVPGQSGVSFIAAGYCHNVIIKPDTAPSGSVSINYGAAKTNSTAVTLTLMCHDMESGCSEMQFSDDNVNWSTPEAVSWNKAWTLTPGDGTKTVYVKFMDNAGNWSDVYSDTIILDSAATSPLVSLGAPLSWGDNLYGQLGNGSRQSSYSPERVSGLTDSAQVAAGWLFTLSLKSDGTVWAWGDNWAGQLGDGTSENFSTIPNQVITGQGTVFSDAIAIDGGNSHSLALKENGSVWAWGANWAGQLGDGTKTDQSIPVQVSGLTGAISVVAGDYHSLALKSDGTVWAWGYNGYGQLGDGTNNSINVPVQVSGLTEIVAVAAGGYHSLALKSDGTVWTWGGNWSGQLGDGTNNSINVPVQVSGLTGVVAMTAAGYHNLALKNDGTIWAWGDNWSGQLGDGTKTVRSIPVQVSGLTEIVAVAAGGYHSLALKSDGTVWTWGGNWAGQLGDGTNNNRNLPVQIPSLTGVAYIAAGGSHTVVIKPVPPDTTPPSGSISINVGAASTNSTAVTLTLTCQDTESGCSEMQFSDDNINWSTPEAVSSSKAWTLTSGDWTKTAYVRFKDYSDNWSGAYSDTIILDSAMPFSIPNLGVPWSWGGNWYGQLGNGRIESSYIPVRVSDLTYSAQVAAGDSFTLSLKSDGTVWAWGDNKYGQLGDGTNSYYRDLPTQVLGLTGIVRVSSFPGGSHSLAIRSDGTVLAWGYNEYGQLGDGTNNNSSSVPVQVSGLSGVVAVAAGGYHSLALKSDGTVWAWGHNRYGQLGNGTTNNSGVPVQISGLTGVIAVAAGGSHSLVLKSDGTVWAWGGNWSGQLGNGSNNWSKIPVQVSGLTGVVAVASGSSHSLALKSDGTVWAWGYNYYGQLGAGITTDSNVPVQISGLTGVAAVAAGEGHNLALKSDGTVWAWGANWYGQLGDGTSNNSSVPVQVPGLTGVAYVAAGGYHTIIIKPDATSPSGSISINYGAAKTNSTAVTLILTCSDTESGCSEMQFSDDNINWSTPEAVSWKKAWTLTPGDGTKMVYVKFKDDKGNWSGVYSDTIILDSAMTSPLVSLGAPLSWGANWAGQLGNGSRQSNYSPVRVSGLTDSAQVAAGDSFTLSLKSDGTVWAWGDNWAGQLGDGTSWDVSAIPVQVMTGSGIPFSGVIAIGSGYAHSLALKGDGTVWTWGYNEAGQLGDGTPTNRSVPVQVSGLTGVVAVAAGDYHNLALKSDGTVWAWGYNEYGQLGDGTTTNSNVPVQVSGLTEVVAVAAGGYHNLALKSDGTVWAWGSNWSGQLGDGTTTNRSAPVQVYGLTGVVAVASGSSHSLAIKSDETVWAWGDNWSGKLGDGTTNNSSVPVQVSGLTGVIAAAADYGHSLALKSDGTVWAWGGNWYGQLGDGTTDDKNLPVQVPGLTGVTYIAAGGWHTLVIKPVPPDTTPPSGAVSINVGAASTNSTTVTLILTCQDTESGCSEMQFSDDNVNWSTPEAVSSSKAWTLAPGDGTKTVYVRFKDYSDNWSGVYSDTIILDSAMTFSLPNPGVPWSWGANWNGQLGDGSTIDSSFPVKVSGLIKAVAVAGGFDHTIALNSDGTVWAWGDNLGGQLGDGTNAYDRHLPTQVLGLTGIVHVSSSPGASHSLALRSDGTVLAWGYNEYGQLGDGTNNNSSSVPIQVSGLSGVVAVAAGGYHNLALKSDGTVWAWGANWNGQLGDGTTNNSSVPVQVSGLTGVVAVAAGGYHSLALKSDGTVWAWGTNWYGQLGNGTTNNRSSVPVQVAGLTGVIAVAAGGYHSLALKSDGTVWAWGANWGGQLGDGTTNNSNVPVQVSGLTGIVTVAAGDYHTLALKSNGTVWAWGANWYGQLGDGTTADRSVPVQVPDLTGVSYISGGGYHTVVIKPVPPDITPPSGSVSINVGAAITNSTAVTLTLACQDTESGCSEMQFSDDNINWSTPEAVSSNKIWTLTSGDGTKTVYVKFKDNAGNWSAAYSANITLDATAPVTTIDFNIQKYSDGQKILISSNTQVVLVASDNLSGVKETNYRLDAEDGWRTYTGAFRLTDLTFGTHIIYYRSSDNVDNTEAEKSVTVVLVGIDVKTDIMNLPRVLVWTRDPSRIPGNNKPTYTLDSIKSFISGALNDKDIYFKTTTDKDEFQKEFRSGIYNMAAVIDQDTPFDAVFLREMREAVNRGMGLLISGWGNTTPPILEEALGVQVSGSLSTTDADRTIYLYQGPVSPEQSLTAKGKILKTSLTTGTLAGIVKGEEACDGVKEVSFKYQTNIIPGDMVKASLYTSSGKKLTLVDEETLSIVRLPTDGVNSYAGNASGDISIDSAASDSAMFSIKAPSGYLGSSYYISMTVQRQDGSKTSTGNIAVTPTCSANLQAGVAIGPINVTDVQADSHKVTDDIPAVVLNSYGKGRTVFLSYDMVETALSRNTAEYAGLLKNTINYMLPQEVKPEAAGISLLETKVKLHGIGMDLKAMDTLGDGLTHLPLFNLTQTPLEYTLHQSGGEETAYRYFVRVKDKIGSYGKDTDISLGINGGYSLFDKYQYNFVVDVDSDLLMQQAVAWVNEQLAVHPEAADSLNTIQNELVTIAFMPKLTAADMDKVVHQVVQTIHHINQLPFDTMRGREILDGYLRVMEGRNFTK